MKKLWNKKTKLVIVRGDDIGVATYTPMFITPTPKSEWPKRGKKLNGYISNRHESTVGYGSVF